MKLLILTFTFLGLFFSGTAQEVIDGTYPFDTDPAKKYSLYIPSSYDASTPNDLMLGLHPLNTSRWDAESWRDTLIVFAETNNLILVCPDGGDDGKIDSPIDTAFTSNLLDSISHWYNINEEEKYIMGFSWGGKTTYSYGLRRTNNFRGFMPIGAAISASDVSDIMVNAQDQPFYLVHGSNDSPGTRYTPLLNSLNSNGACVESILMNGVGHTIDFPNRNAILSTAFQWLKEQNCGQSSTHEIFSQLEIFPNPTADFVEISGLQNYKVTAFDFTGRKIQFNQIANKISFDSAAKGLIYLAIEKDNTQTIRKIIKL